MRILILILLAVSVAEASAQQLPDGFAFETLASLPTGSVAFDILPDGRILVIHKNTGDVSIWRPGDAVAQTIHTVPNLSTAEERGLIGIAVDPAWPARPYVYFYLNHDSGVARLVLVEASGDLTDPTSTALVLASPYPVLDDIPDTGTHHKAGWLRFDAQGRLYASIGDDDQMCTAQDPTDLRGTIVRLDVSQLPQAGPGPPPKSLITPADNPLPGPDENERLVYAWGLRNPFRFDVDPLTGRLIIADVGSEEFEEVNDLPVAVAGANFGWPLREGAAPDNPGLTCGQANTLTDPVYAYPRGERAAVIGGVIYRDPGGGFGPAYEGDYFFYDFLGQFLRRLTLNNGTWVLADPVPGQPTSTDWATDLGATTCFRVGRDGSLTFLNYRYAGANPTSGLYRIVRTAAVGVFEDPTPTKLSVTVAPNPGASGTGFSFRHQAGRGTLHLKIFDVAGRVIRTLQIVEVETPGETVWDGTDDLGRPVSSGVYFYRLQDEHHGRAQGKLTVIR